MVLRPHLSMGLPFRSQFQQSLYLIAQNPALVGAGLLILTSLFRQPGCPRSLSLGPVVLRPHLSMGLPFRSRSLFCCHTPIIAQSDQRVGKGYVRALLVLREERLK